MRRRSWIVLVAAVVTVLAGAGGAVFLLRSGGGVGAHSSGAGGGSSMTPAHLTALVLRAPGGPYVAVIGSMGSGRPLALDVPSRLVLIVPGSGTALAGREAATSGEATAAALSNSLGAWVEHYGVLDSDGLRRTVDAAGGVKLGGSTVGGSAAVRSLASLSTASTADRVSRWRGLLRGLLSARAEWSGFVESDDPGAVQQALQAASGAEVRPLPTRTASGGLLQIAASAVRTLLQTRLGIEAPAPVDVIALNGSGVPGVGQSLARKLVPGGFRIVQSGNASSFDHDGTVVYASSRRAMPDAERALRLLGVGQVVLGGGASGLADITIVVGKDFGG